MTKASDDGFLKARATIDKASDGVFWVGADGRITYVNDAVVEMLDASREELLAKPLWDVDASLSEERWERQWRRLKRQRKLVYESTLRGPDGRTVPVAVSGRFVRIGGEEFHFLFAHDLRKRRRVEAALKVSEQRFAATIDSLGDMIHVVDSDLRIVLCNTAFTQAMRHFRLGDAAVGLPLREAVPFLSEKVFEEYRAVLEDARPLVTEESTGFGDETVWTETRKTPLVDRDGDVTGVVTIVRDITERRSVEDSLRQSEERYRTFVAATAQGIWQLEFDPAVPIDAQVEEQVERILRDCRVAECNDAVARMYGFERGDEVVGAQLMDLFAATDPDNEAFFRVFVEAGYEVSESETHEHDRFGNDKYFLNTLHGVVDHGELIRLWGTQIDITERKLAEMALARRDAILGAVTFAAQRFLQAETWRHVIAEVLVRIGQAAQVSRVYIFENSDDENGVTLLEQLFEWCAAGADSQLANPRLSGISYEEIGEQWALELMQTGEVMHGPTRGMPPDMQRELLEQDILSIAEVPIFVGERMWGLIGFDDCVSERIWAPAEIDALKTAAGMIGAAILHESTQAALEESRSFTEHLLETTPNTIYLYDVDAGRFDFLNRQVESMLGYSAEAFAEMGRDAFQRLVHDEDRPALGQHMAALAAADDGTVLGMEYRMKAASGEWRYVLSQHIVASRWPDGRLWRLLGTATDITDRRLAEEELRASEERYRDLFEHSPVALWVEDYSDVKVYLDTLRAQGVEDFDAYLRDHRESFERCCELLRLVDVNETTLKMYGAESKSVLIDGYSSVWSQETESCLRMSFVAVATGVRRMTYEDVNVSLDGEEIHVAETWAVAPGYEDSYGRVYLSDVDITDRRLAELALRESQDRYRSLFEQSPVGVWTYDTSGVIADCNESFATILGSPRERLIGFDMKTMQDQRVRPAVDAALQGEVGFYEGEYRATLNQKHVIWISARTAPLRDAWGGTTGGMGVISDLTQLRETEERVKYLAVHDEVTGLANRTLFQDRLGQAIAFAGRSKQKLAVAVVDIDRFRHINETLGYAAGDRLLREVGERMIESVRGDDSVARGSGDEYLLLFPGLARAQDVVRVADRVMDGFAAPWTVAGDEYFLTPSMGVAVYPADGTDVETLVSNAEKALHRAKQLGRSHCQYFDASMNLAIAQRLTLERELHHALERNEFEVHYQPLVDVASGTLAGFEALVRWRHPKRGLLLPGEFIELAESTGLIIPMGERVLRAACRQAKAWMDEGRGDIVVSVNLSPRQFFQGDLVATVAGALATSGLKTGALGIEVTETVAVEDVDRASSILEQLRTLGVRVGLDDFGTGYSSLSHLREVPIDIVKIDRSFIAGVNNGGGDAAVASAIVAMGRTMGLTIIAEGVETTEQLAFVRERGCDLFQGFLVSRAVPADERAAFFGGRLA